MIEVYNRVFFADALFCSKNLKLRVKSFDELGYLNYDNDRIDRSFVCLDHRRYLFCLDIECHDLVLNENISRSFEIVKKIHAQIGGVIRYTGRGFNILNYINVENIVSILENDNIKMYDFIYNFVLGIINKLQIDKNFIDLQQYQRDGKCRGYCRNFNIKINNVHPWCINILPSYSLNDIFEKSVNNNNINLIIPVLEEEKIVEYYSTYKKGTLSITSTLKMGHNYEIDEKYVITKYLDYEYFPPCIKKIVEDKTWNFNDRKVFCGYMNSKRVIDGSILNYILSTIYYGNREKFDRAMIKRNFDFYASPGFMIKTCAAIKACNKCVECGFKTPNDGYSVKWEKHIDED